MDQPPRGSGFGPRRGGMLAPCTLHDHVEGAQQAYAALRPGLDKIDTDLVSKLDGQFQSVLTTLDGYRDPGAIVGFTPYTAELQASDAAKLTAAIQPLHDSLSSVAQKVV